MEGVEDIPGAALAEGIRWGWETFPEFLDALDAQPLALDVGTQVPHGAVRGYVMGERGARNEPATPDDIEAMARIVREGIEAGALGVSTSRTIAHRAIDGEPVPGTFAAEDELFALGRALGELGAGVFELAPAGVLGEDLAAPDREMDWMRRLSAATGRPVTFALIQHDLDPDQWQQDARPRRRGLRPRRPDPPAGRGPPARASCSGCRPSTRCATARRTRRSARCRSTSRWRGCATPRCAPRILAESPATRRRHGVHRARPRPHLPLGDPPDYEPAPRREHRRDAPSARAATRPGPLYDLLLEDDGRELLLRPLLGYSDFTQDPIREMLLHPTTALGLGDGGAHVRRDLRRAASRRSCSRTGSATGSRGERLPLELVVRKMTATPRRSTASATAACSRSGRRATSTSSTSTRLTLRRPRWSTTSRPAPARLVQTADGYDRHDRERRGRPARRRGHRRPPRHAAARRA